VILLNELLTQHFGIGMILIIIGVVMVTLSETTAKAQIGIVGSLASTKF
jgi:hypothetical protein